MRVLFGPLLGAVRSLVWESDFRQPRFVLEDFLDQTHSDTLKKKDNYQITQLDCQPTSMGIRTRVAHRNKTTDATTHSPLQVKHSETMLQKDKENTFACHRRG